MKSHARVVVIGGGIMGAGLLYHLAKEGWSDVVLVEKGELTSGSTWHAAAFIPHFSGNPAMARIHRYASKIYQELEAETGQATGFHNCGTIRLGFNQDELDWYMRVQAMLRSQGTECHIIGTDEIAKLHPLLNLDGIKCAIYTPGDGHTDPFGSTNALAIGARQRGAEIYLRNRVVEINARPDGYWDVVTEKGTIVAEHVVNAAGSFAPQVGAMVGAKVPVVSIPHHYLVTEALDEVKALDHETPTVRDPRASCYYREEQQGLIIGPYEVERAETWGVDGVDWSFDMQLLPPNMDVIMPCLEMAAERVPAFANAGIKQVINGPITHVPDLGILIGPASGFRNFWLCCGSSVGVTQGPGAGKYLAQWMVHGQADIDISALDARRFGDWAVGSYCNERSLDGYHKMFQVALPNKRTEVGRPVRTSAIYDKLKAKGAIFSEVFGWEVPRWFATEGTSEHYSYRRTNWFDTVAEECRAVREQAGVMDKSSVTKFDISGPNATAYLEKILANPLPREDGGIVIAYALTEKAGVECEFTVTRLSANNYYLVAPAVAQLRSLDWLTCHLESFKDLIVSDITDVYGVLALSGPRSRDILAMLTGHDLGNEAFPLMQARDLTVAGRRVRALRWSDVGEIGWELHLETGDVASVYDALHEAGKDHGIVDFGLHAANAMRMEIAGKSWEHDFRTPATLIEAGFDISSCADRPFIGADALHQQAEAGAARHLVYLEIEAQDADAMGVEQIFSGDRAIGLTTSGAFGHTVGKSLAFGFVEPAFATGGADLEVEILGKRRPARVLTEAAYDAEGNRP